jgi:hypothetical protein
MNKKILRTLTALCAALVLMASQEHLTTIETALCELDAALNKE